MKESVFINEILISTFFQTQRRVEIRKMPPEAKISYAEMVRKKETIGEIKDFSRLGRNIYRLEMKKKKTHTALVFQETMAT